jgi:hypothetical protein
MPDMDDDDYDGVDLTRRKPTLRWNRFKWCLFIANLLLTLYSIVALVSCLLFWFNIWEQADIVRVAHANELRISTAAASLGLLTAMLGWSGILLNNRPFLAIYSFLLWVIFILIVAPGYITHKKYAYDLEGKVNFQWSRTLGVEGRLRLQNQLHCCGYFSPFVEATVSQSCYARSMLPGCKGPFIRFERKVLKKWFTIVFSVAGVHLVVMVTALLCSNHVTYRFGKGMIPKAYRLDANSMAVFMDNYANELAQQYGDNFAQEPPSRSSHPGQYTQYEKGWNQSYETLGYDNGYNNGSNNGNNNSNHNGGYAYNRR